MGKFYSRLLTQREESHIDRPHKYHYILMIPLLLCGILSSSHCWCHYSLMN